MIWKHYQDTKHGRTTQKWLHDISAEMEELILADNDRNSDGFSLPSNSSYRDSDENFEQTIVPSSDSGEPRSNVSRSETESDEDGDFNVSFNAAYYATKDLAVKWRKYTSSGAGRPQAQYVLQESGPSNYAPTSIASPKDDFNLTFPIKLVHKVIEFSNQRY